MLFRLPCPRTGVSCIAACSVPLDWRSFLLSWLKRIVTRIWITGILTYKFTFCNEIKCIMCIYENRACRCVVTVSHLQPRCVKHWDSEMRNTCVMKESTTCHLQGCELLCIPLTEFPFLLLVPGRKEFSCASKTLLVQSLCCCWRWQLVWRLSCRICDINMAIQY